MNLFIHPIHGAEIAQRYQHEAEVARMLSLAPRRRAGRPTLARALRSIAQRLSAYADRLEPVHARAAWHAHTAPRNAH